MLRKPKLTNRRSPSLDTQPSKVYSYYAARQPSDTPRRQLPGQARPVRAKGINWRLVPSLVALVAVIVSLGYSLTLSTYPRLDYVTAESTDLLQPEAVYQRALQGWLSKSLFDQNKVTINTKELEKRLTDTYPELASASITVPLLNRRPILGIKPAQPVMILLSDGERYLLDNNGRVLLSLSGANSGSAKDLPLVQDDSGLDIKVGQTALPGNEVSFIKEVFRQITGKGKQIEMARLPTEPSELHIKLIGQNYFVKFDTRGEGLQQAGTYLAADEELGAKGVTPAEYIDVRVEEKAFYK